jgi:hypothetical protein
MIMGEAIQRDQATPPVSVKAGTMADRISVGRPRWQPGCHC